MKIEKCQGGISSAPPLSKLYLLEEITETDVFSNISGGGLCLWCFIIYPWVLDRIFGSCVPEPSF